MSQDVGGDMGVYIYCIKEDYARKTAIRGREFSNEWFALDKDGTVTIKGSNKNGYSWDGCSPKKKFLDIYVGTPEAVLNFTTGKTKTYYASLIHDVFYQFSKDVKSFISRKEVDKEFCNILKADGFRAAKIYYGVVRSLGWLFW